MNKTLITEFRDFSRKRMIESNPLSDIAILSLNKIIQDLNLTREEKLRRIIEFNFPFEIVEYALLNSKNSENMGEIDFAFILLQLINWYKISSIQQVAYYTS